jgi:hypothetical protein
MESSQSILAVIDFSQSDDDDLVQLNQSFLELNEFSMEISVLLHERNLEVSEGVSSLNLVLLESGNLSLEVSLELVEELKEMLQRSTALGLELNELGCEGIDVSLLQLS